MDRITLWLGHYGRKNCLVSLSRFSVPRTPLWSVVNGAQESLADLASFVALHGGKKGDSGKQHKCQFRDSRSCSWFKFKNTNFEKEIALLKQFMEIIYEVVQVQTRPDTLLKT